VQFLQGDLLRLSLSLVYFLVAPFSLVVDQQNVLLEFVGFLLGLVEILTLKITPCNVGSTPTVSPILSYPHYSITGN